MIGNIASAPLNYCTQLYGGELQYATRVGSFLQPSIVWCAVVEISLGTINRAPGSVYLLSTGVRWWMVDSDENILSWY